ncbi:hypothetical protein QUB68_07180 [Microcoleus sp. A006_D1]
MAVYTDSNNTDAALMSLQPKLKPAGDRLQDSYAARTSSSIFHKKIGEKV